MPALVSFSQSKLWFSRQDLGFFANGLIFKMEADHFAVGRKFVSWAEFYDKFTSYFASLNVPFARAETLRL